MSYPANLLAIWVGESLLELYSRKNFLIAAQLQVYSLSRRRQDSLSHYKQLKHAQNYLLGLPRVFEV